MVAEATAGGVNHPMPPDARANHSGVLPLSGRIVQPMTPSRGEEVEMLRNEAEELTKQLDTIEQRMHELAED
jgi:hypothetical protein